MSDIPRRKLDELEFIYKNHPDLRDIYVEGSFDKSILDWFVRERGLKDVAIYLIDTIEISDEDVIARGYYTGNRGRVMCLAEHLKSISASHVVCIIDSDFSRFLDDEPPQPPLYETDYACMEMYYFNIFCFSKFFTLCCQRSNWQVNTIMQSLASVLQELFLYRCANEKLGWRMDWLDTIAGCMKTQKWSINLDFNNFIGRLLNKNQRAKHKDAFNKMVESLRSMLKKDPRYQINGHDFVIVLAWYIRKKGVSTGWANEDNVRISLASSLDDKIFTQEQMFRDLTTRLS
jgi:hypothetical protein